MVLTFSSCVTLLPTYRFSSNLPKFLLWILYYLEVALIQRIDHNFHLLRKTPMEQHEYRHKPFLPSNLCRDEKYDTVLFSIAIINLSLYISLCSSSSIQLLQILLIRIAKGNVTLCFFWLPIFNITYRKYTQIYWFFAIKTSTMWKIGYKMWSCK